MHKLARYSRKWLTWTAIGLVVLGSSWAAPSSSNTITGERAKPYLGIVNEGRNEEDLVPLSRLALRESSWTPAILVGFVTDNQHVILGGVVVNQKNYNLRTASKFLLDSAGWSNADSDSKDQLVLRFVSEILVGFDQGLVTQLPEKFPKPNKKTTFKAPTVTSSPTGGRLFDGWISENPNLSGNPIYRHSLYLFSANGELVRSRTVERVVIE
jgi:hypothetical protein